MYFLINDVDNSVNFASEEPIPAFMNHAGTTKIEAEIDHLPDGINLIDCFWDPETSKLIPPPEGLKRLTENELAEFINQQQLINEAITAADEEKYIKLIRFLEQVFPDNADIKAMLSDNAVTQEELQQIEDMLGNK